MSVENEKEIQQLKNRIRELADKSYNQNQYTFTGFLGLAEQDALWQVEREVKFAGITLYGGREEAERKILRFGSEAPEGHKSSLNRTAMLMLAVTIHNFPEGAACGAIFAGVLSGDGTVTMAGALTLAIGIAIQNFPEGAIISLPLRSEGNKRSKSFALGVLSGAVEPVGAILAIALASIVTPILPYMLAFAAGAMIYVVVEELIPEASEGEHSNLGTIAFAIGFALMMMLDVALG